jgi:hypothetical protein
MTLPCGTWRIAAPRWSLAGGHLAALAFALSLGGAATAAAQSVVVTHAPAGTTVDVVRDAAAVGSAAADADGVARITVPEAARLEHDIDGLLYVDTCPDRRRVIILERHRQIAPIEVNCTRQEIPGLFLIKSVSTLAIDVAVTPPRLLLRQGKFDPMKPEHLWTQVPLGLAFSGAIGIDRFSDPKENACGNVPTCTNDNFGTAYAGGVAFWFMRYLGGEVTYLRPAEWTAEGAGDYYRFTNSLDAEMLTTAALIGGPVGPVRMYGKVGGVYHRATFSTTEPIDEKTLTVDVTPPVVRGGTYASAYRTQGWGWMFGGGFEFWLSRYFAAYAEADFVQLRGGDPAGGEGVAEERVTTIMGGVKLHLSLQPLRKLAPKPKQGEPKQGGTPPAPPPN